MAKWLATSLNRESARLKKSMSVSTPAKERIDIDEVKGRHRFTVEEYFALSELGILERTELIEGDIYDMSAHSSRHRAVVKMVADALTTVLRDRATVFVQSTLAFEGWGPEPDVMVLRHDPHLYLDRQPAPDEIYLIIEVADTTLAKDKGIKLRNYAKEGIPEYWVINFVDSFIEVYRQPRGEDFDEKTTHTFDEPIAPSAFPDIRRSWLKPS
jgi:Uma2 family endonuclease